MTSGAGGRYPNKLGVSMDLFADTVNRRNADTTGNHDVPFIFCNRGGKTPVCRIEFDRLLRFYFRNAICKIPKGFYSHGEILLPTV
jgi:hypothetical protein